MTDKSIDELVAAIGANTLYFHDGSDPAHDAAVELASIAKEAEGCDTCTVLDAGWCVVDDAGGTCKCGPDGDFMCVEKRHLTALEDALDAQKSGGEYLDVRVARANAEAEQLRKERDWLARKCEWLESQTVNAQKANTWDSAEQYIAAAREAAES